MIQDLAAGVGRFGRKLLQLHGAGQIAGFHFVRDVVPHVAKDAVTAETEFRREGIEAGAARAQQFDPPALIVATDLTLTRDSMASHAANSAAKKRRSKTRQTTLQMTTSRHHAFTANSTILTSSGYHIRASYCISLRLFTLSCRVAPVLQTSSAPATSFEMRNLERVSAQPASSAPAARRGALPGLLLPRTAKATGGRGAVR